MTEPAAIEIRRRLSAPPAEVFRWWTEPARLCEWMTPTGTVEAEVDLKVGGALRIVMRDAQTTIEHRGVFLEIEAPRRLKFTWRSEFAGEGSVVTVELEPDGADATKLRLVHSALPTEAAAASHRGGWSAMLDRLAYQVATGAQPRPAG